MKSFAIRTLAWLTSFLSPRASATLAGPLSGILWRVSRRLREVARTNVALCFPSIGEEEQEQLARRSLWHYTRNALELGMCWRWPRARFDAIFEPPVGWDLVEDALESGEGLIVLAPHFGAWEALGLMLSDVLSATLFKPGSDPAVDRVLQDHRQRFGATLVPANRRGLKSMFSVLSEGKAAALLPDQEPRLGDGRFAPFFDVPALTGVLAPRLLQRTGARALFLGCVREPQGRYRVHVIPAHEDIGHRDLDRALAAMNRGVEQIVALDPEQYLWPYKRFRATPEGGKRY